MFFITQNCKNAPLFCSILPVKIASYLHQKVQKSHFTTQSMFELCTWNSSKHSQHYSYSEWAASHSDSTRVNEVRWKPPKTQLPLKTWFVHFGKSFKRFFFVMLLLLCHGWCLKSRKSHEPHSRLLLFTFHDAHCCIVMSNISLISDSIAVGALHAALQF